jgi:hypothetical protein
MYNLNDKDAGAEACGLRPSPRRLRFLVIRQADDGQIVSPDRAHDLQAKRQFA